MARRGSITETQVFEAANTLTAQGREVTPTALLSILGSGSFTTIYKHLASWEANRASTSTNQPPAEMPESVHGAFVAVWRVAIEEVAREVIAVGEKAAEEVNNAANQFQEAVHTIKRLEAAREVEAARFDTITAKVEELQYALHKLENEKSARKATEEQLRHHHQVKSQESGLERAHKDAEIERKWHQDELALARMHKENAIKEAAELRGRADTLEAQNGDLLS